MRAAPGPPARTNTSTWDTFQLHLYWHRTESKSALLGYAAPIAKPKQHIQPSSSYIHLYIYRYIMKRTCCWKLITTNRLRALPGPGTAAATAISTQNAAALWSQPKSKSSMAERGCWSFSLSSGSYFKHPMKYWRAGWTQPHSTSATKATEVENTWMYLNKPRPKSSVTTGAESRGRKASLKLRVSNTQLAAHCCSAGSPHWRRLNSTLLGRIQLF